VDESLFEPMPREELLELLLLIELEAADPLV
jgi:hypothetical protein